jgi:RNA polymerase sigma factor (sigma-70 family)
MEDLVEQAKRGDRHVLEEIVRRIQDRIYGLAIRMLFIPADAQDATQEILVKVVTHLGTFKRESRFETWVFSIASNHLMTMSRNRAERWRITFDFCREAVDRAGPPGGSDPSPGAEQQLIVREMERSCIHYLLLCLGRELRLAFILGEIVGVSSAEGAEILGLKQAAYRQRLSRAKKQVLGFLSRQCGLVDTGNPCRCEALAAYQVEMGYLDPKRPRFAEHPCLPPQDGEAKDLLKEMGRMAGAARVIRHHPDYAAPGAFVESMKNLIDSGKFRLLGGPLEQ